MQLPVSSSENQECQENLIKQLTQTDYMLAYFCPFFFQMVTDLKIANVFLLDITPLTYDFPKCLYIHTVHVSKKCSEVRDLNLCINMVSMYKFAYI